MGKKMADGGETDFDYEHDLDPGSGSIFIPGHNSKLNENRLIKLRVYILTKEQMLSVLRQVMVSVIDCGIASDFHLISLEIAACDCSIMMLLFSSVSLMMTVGTRTCWKVCQVRN